MEEVLLQNRYLQDSFTTRKFFSTPKVPAHCDKTLQTSQIYESDHDFPGNPHVPHLCLAGVVEPYIKRDRLSILERCTSKYFLICLQIFL